TEDAGILLGHHRAMHGDAGGDCTCLVSGYRTNPVDAAFLNSHMIRAMDFNDIYWKADPAHPSDLLGGPLAVCEMKGLSGRDLILATVVAYEIEMRLVEIGRPGVREYGWHHATLTGFAAPFAAGKALGLSEEQLVNAAGICASRTGSLGAVTAGKLTMMKNTVDPWATRMGVESALLASRGYSGPEHIFDGKEGLFHVFGHSVCNGEPCMFDGERLVRDLPASAGDAYRIESCGMKSFPIEALSHAPLSAMMKIVAEHSIAPDDVAEIKVEVIARAADILGDPHKYRPTSRETADHSLPYSLAVGLVDGKVTPLQFEDERVRDPALIPIMDKVKVVANEEFESRFPEFQPSRVTITLVDGTSHVRQVDVPKGDPRDPMTQAEIKVKFDALGAGVIGQERCDALGEWIMNLDGQTSLDGLFSLAVR
ncbi:MAG TPA: MmgE/PrpD family protein, partial [Phycisphaerales bacterium]|nr:MmgE/PrpD family protein [Phycisphaerales bacterium]